MLAKSVENSCTYLNRGQVIIPLSTCYATTALESLLPVATVVVNLRSQYAFQIPTKRYGHIIGRWSECSSESRTDFLLSP